MSGDRNQTRIRTRRLAISAILAAIGVVLLYIGALIEVLDLTVVVFASFVCVLAVIEMGGVWPWLIYATVSVLSLVLLPQKAPALLFLLFGGYYPILKACFERWCPRIIAWIHFEGAFPDARSRMDLQGTLATDRLCRWKCGVFTLRSRVNACDIGVSPGVS